MGTVLARGLQIENNEKILIRLLEEAKIRKRKVVIWDLVDGRKISVTTRVTDINRTRNTFNLQLEDRNIPKLLCLVSGQEYVFLALPTEKILTFCRIERFITDDMICLQFPPDYAYSRINRRKFERYQNVQGDDIRVKFKLNFRYNNQLKTQVFSKVCIDIGEGGISFLCNNLEKKHFELYADINDIDLNMEGLKLKVNAIIVRAADVDPKDELFGVAFKGMKVSLMFIGLSEEEAQKLAEYVEDKLLVVSRKAAKESNAKK